MYKRGVAQSSSGRWKESGYHQKKKKQQTNRRVMFQWPKKEVINAGFRLSVGKWLVHLLLHNYTRFSQHLIISMKEWVYGGLVTTLPRRLCQLPCKYYVNKYPGVPWSSSLPHIPTTLLLSLHFPVKDVEENKGFEVPLPRGSLFRNRFYGSSTLW